MSRKKIVFIIVEGPSDEDALGVLLNRIYDNKAVYVHVMHCDITTERDVNPGNIVSKIGSLVKNYANQKFKSTDAKPIYSETEIRTQQKAGIEDRNRRKRENLNKLSSTSKVWSIPY